MRVFVAGATGAEPAVADGLDRAAVIEAVVRSEPEVVVHEMTGLRGVTNSTFQPETSEH